MPDDNATPEAAVSPLDRLEAHFEARKPHPIELDGFDGLELFAKPLNGEGAFKVAKANANPNAKIAARAFAEVVVEHVTLADGSRAFQPVKGKPSPVERLLAGDPDVFSALVAAVCRGEEVGEAETVGKS